MALSPPLVVCIPSSDRAFRAAVEGALGPVPTDAADLEARVRGLYPGAIVRARDLTDEPRPIWYAYRDGRFTPEPDTSWHEEPRTAWVRLSTTDGRILDANEALAALVGRPGESLVGRNLADFIFPENAEMQARQFDAVLRGETLHSVGRARTLDGDEVFVEYVGRIVDGDVHGWYRAATVVGPDAHDPRRLA